MRWRRGFPGNKSEFLLDAFFADTCISFFSTDDIMSAPLVSVIMGSDSDLRVMQKAVDILDQLLIVSEVTIVSAHRTPHRMFEFATSAEARGIRVIIAGAGGAAHLPGMVAALTPLPVIGVPVNATPCNGHDSLLSIVQMPAGIPVATVAIDNATNAGLLAAQMLGIADQSVRERISAYRASLESIVMEKVRRLEQGD
jgi:phosphoribosylaminoimidazole carboxylase PurE protein